MTTDRAREFTEQHLIENGLLDPDQPTRQATKRHRSAMMAEFTPMERYAVRVLLADALRAVIPDDH